MGKRGKASWSKREDLVRRFVEGPSTTNGILADYFDGFTGRLLKWTLVAREGVAFGQADWFSWPEPSMPYEFRVPFDVQGVVSRLPELLCLEREYEPPIDDMEDRLLIVRTPGQVWTCHVYAGWYLRQRGNALEPFFAVWDPIERMVEDLVAAEMKAREPPAT